MFSINEHSGTHQCKYRVREGFLCQVSPACPTSMPFPMSTPYPASFQAQLHPFISRRGKSHLCAIISQGKHLPPGSAKNSLCSLICAIYSKLSWERAAASFSCFQEDERTMLLACTRRCEAVQGSRRFSSLPELICLTGLRLAIKHLPRSTSELPATQQNRSPGTKTDKCPEILETTGTHWSTAASCFGIIPH